MGEPRGQPLAVGKQGARQVRDSCICSGEIRGAAGAIRGAGNRSLWTLRFGPQCWEERVPLVGREEGNGGEKGGGHWTVQCSCWKVLPALSAGDLSVIQHLRITWAGSTVDGQGPALVWQVHLTSVHGRGGVGIEITHPEGAGSSLRVFRFGQESPEKQKVRLGVYGSQRHRKGGVLPNGGL